MEHTSTSTTTPNAKSAARSAAVPATELTSSERHGAFVNSLGDDRIWRYTDGGAAEMTPGEHAKLRALRKVKRQARRIQQRKRRATPHIKVPR